MKSNAAFLLHGRNGLKKNLVPIMASHSINMFYLFFQKLPGNLICSERSDASKYWWSPKLLNKLSPKHNTKSRLNLFHKLSSNKLLTEHYRNITYQQFGQTLNDNDRNFLGQIFSRTNEGITNLCTTKL